MRRARRRDPDHLGQLGLAGVAEQPPGHDDDGRVRRGHAKLGEQGLGARVGFQVQPPVREPVTGREIPQPPGIRRIPGADDPQAHPEPDQQRAADQAGAQDQVAEDGIAEHQLLEPIAGHGEHLTLVGGHGAVEGGLPGQQAELAEETPAAMPGDDVLLRRPAPFHDDDVAAENHEEVAVPVAFGEQHLVRLHRTLLAERGQRGDLGVVQPGVSPVEVRGLARPAALLRGLARPAAMPRPGLPRPGLPRPGLPRPGLPRYALVRHRSR